MSEPDLDDFAVDPSRVTYGLRRYWWVIALCVVAGLLAALVPGTSPAAFDIELRESASRTRLGARPEGEIALLEFRALVDVMNSTDRQDAVDELAGEAVSYTASLTPTGLVALRVVAPSEESAREQSSYVVEVLDDWLLDEQREVVGQRVAELTQSTESLSEKIDSINFSTGDDVRAILERSSLIGALVRDQRDLTQLTSALDQSSPGTTSVRTSISSGSSRNKVVLGVVAGALVGLAVAAGLGLARRRVRDATDLRRIVDPLPVFITTSDASPSATAALVTGVVAELGEELRSSISFAAVGESTRDLHEKMLQTSSKFGLGLERTDGGNPAIHDQVLTLVAANADWAAVLDATAGSSLLMVVQNGDPIDDVTEQMKLFRTSRLPLVGCVLVS